MLFKHLQCLPTCYRKWISPAWFKAQLTLIHTFYWAQIMALQDTIKREYLTLLKYTLNRSPQYLYLGFIPQFSYTTWESTSGFANYTNSLFTESKSISLWILACFFFFPQAHTLFLYSTVTVVSSYIFILIILSQITCIYLLLDGSFTEDRILPCNF